MENPDINNNNTIVPSLTGAFQNQLGSEVHLIAKSNGELDGEYRTNVGTATTAKNLRGFWSYDPLLEMILVAFSVSWDKVLPGKAISMCSWTGRVEKDGDLHLQWLLSSAEEPQWKSTHINKDVFRKLTNNKSDSKHFNVKVFQSINDSNLGNIFIYRLETSSTMDISKREIEEGPSHGTVILAEQQTKSQARKETRNWSSPASGNLYFTVILVVPREKLTQVLPASALSVVNAIKQETGIEASVKWPNDVWINSKKVSGALARSEAGPSDNLYYVQLGVGINVNEDMSLNNNPSATGEPLSAVAISISQAAGRLVSRERVLAFYLSALEDYLNGHIDPVIRDYVSKSIFKSGDNILVHRDGIEGPGNQAVVSGPVINNDFCLVVDKYPNLSDKESILSAEEVTRVRLA